MQVSSAPLAEFVSLLSLNDNKMTDIKLLFASKYHIYVWVRVKRGNGKTKTEKRKSGKKGKRRKSGKAEKRVKGGKAEKG